MHPTTAQYSSCTVNFSLYTYTFYSETERKISIGYTVHTHKSAVFYHTKSFKVIVSQVKQKCTIAFVRGWATLSSDGRTHAGYILNHGRSMRAYAVPGQRITLIFKTVLLSRSRRGG
jgi:hypothetical protein